jgi:gliding motility-associated-like protein
MLITDSVICSYEDTIDVSARVQNDGSISEGYTLTWHTDPGGGTFKAPNAPSTQFVPSASAKATGSVKVYAQSDAIGKCPTVGGQTNMTINKAPVAAIHCDSCEGCEPLNVRLAALPTGISDAKYTWTWVNNAYNPSNDSATVVPQLYSGNGKAKVSLTVESNSTGCKATSPYQETFVHAKPKAVFTPDPRYSTVAKPFFSFNNTSFNPDNSAMTYTWNMGPLKPYFMGDRIMTEKDPRNVEFPADTGHFSVWLNVKTQYGCADSTLDSVHVEPDITVFVPSAFHPSSTVPCNDGEPDCNTKFWVAAQGYATIEIFVFNRWGQQVFYTNNASIGWDGTVKNNGTDICPQEVYIYQINATSFNGKAYKYSGSVTLLK